MKVQITLCTPRPRPEPRPFLLELEPDFTDGSLSLLAWRAGWSATAYLTRESVETLAAQALTALGWTHPLQCSCAPCAAEEEEQAKDAERTRYLDAGEPVDALSGTEGFRPVGLGDSSPFTKVVDLGPPGGAERA